MARRAPSRGEGTGPGQRTNQKAACIIVLGPGDERLERKEPDTVLIISKSDDALIREHTGEDGEGGGGGWWGGCDVRQSHAKQAVSWGAGEVGST